MAFEYNIYNLNNSVTPDSEFEPVEIQSRNSSLFGMFPKVNQLGKQTFDDVNLSCYEEEEMY